MLEERLAPTWHKPHRVFSPPPFRPRRYGIFTSYPGSLTCRPDLVYRLGASLPGLLAFCPDLRWNEITNKHSHIQAPRRHRISRGVLGPVTSKMSHVKVGPSEFHASALLPPFRNGQEKPRESHVSRAPVAVWLDSGGQLLQPSSSTRRVDAKVWYRCGGRVAERRYLSCAPQQAHGYHETIPWQREEVGGGLFHTGKKKKKDGL